LSSISSTRSAVSTDLELDPVGDVTVIRIPLLELDLIVSGEHARERVLHWIDKPD
jgi:hypothetical protein